MDSSHEEKKAFFSSKNFSENSKSSQINWFTNIYNKFLIYRVHKFKLRMKYLKTQPTTYKDSSGYLNHKIAYK